MRARRLITGTPTVVIQKGKILYKNMRKCKIEINDLLQEARTNGYFDLSQIEYALMEANGKISFLQKSKYQPVTCKDMKIKTSFEGLCANVIIDGKIMPNNLLAVGKDEEWLRTRIKNNHYDNIHDLLLVTLDSNEQLSFFEKNRNLEEEKMLQ